MGWWRQNDPRSEYEGRGTLESTLFPSTPVDAGEELRLHSLTGQGTDPKAPLDPYVWQGNIAPVEPPRSRTEREIIDAADPY